MQYRFGSCRLDMASRQRRLQGEDPQFIWRGKHLGEYSTDVHAKGEADVLGGAAQHWQREFADTGGECRNHESAK